MPVTPAKATSSPSDTKQHNQLRVNAYDRTAASIIASLIVVGVLVLCLAVIFFASRDKVIVATPVAVVAHEASSPNANQGYADQPDPPGVEDAPEFSEPGLESTMKDLISAAGSEQVLLSDDAIRAGQETGKGSGLGDARMPGPGGDGVIERVPRWERWKIRFEPDSEGEFARWLDYYKIEVGVLGRDNRVHYGFNFSQNTPQTRAGEPIKESRGYTSAADGPMPTLTEDLARKAGLAELGSIVLLFYPFEVESQLWTMENEYSKGRNVNTIRETVFTVTRDGGNFGFNIIDQKYF